MHHLHFRYVTEQPRYQTIRRLFQLLDDMPADLRQPLLRDVFVHFDASSDLTTEKGHQAGQYRALKSKLQQFVEALRSEEPLVYGLVCFILGNAHSRHMIGLPRVIDRKRDLVNGGLLTESASLESLHQEAEVLRKAYGTFCELVVAPLLGDAEVMDFGSEWLFDESEPLPPAAAKEALARQQSGSPNDEVAGTAADVSSASAPRDPCDPIITTFLDQIAAHFEVTLMLASGRLAVRVADKAVSVTVAEYCAPSEREPTKPLILRMHLQGLPPYDKAFRQLGLPFNPKYYLHCRLEFSVLPSELPLLSTWTAEWIRGQESRNPNAPPIPILLAGEQEFFVFTGDENETSPFMEPLAEHARTSFASGGSDWLSVDYLWSKAAREAYNAWASKKPAG